MKNLMLMYKGVIRRFQNSLFLDLSSQNWHKKIRNQLGTCYRTRESLRNDISILDSSSENNGIKLLHQYIKQNNQYLIRCLLKMKIHPYNSCKIQKNIKKYKAKKRNCLFFLSKTSTEFMQKIDHTTDYACRKKQQILLTKTESSDDSKKKRINCFTIIDD